MLGPRHGTLPLEVSGSAAIAQGVQQDSRFASMLLGASPVLKTSGHGSRRSESSTLIGTFGTTLTGTLQSCSTLAELREASASLSVQLSDQPAAWAVFVDVVTRQCCKLLQCGWMSPKDADEAISLLARLAAEGLIEVGEVQLGVANALARLLRRKTAGCRPSFRGNSPWESVDTRLQLWVSHAQLTARSANAGLVPTGCSGMLQDLLLQELQDCLRGATLQDLKASVGKLQLGSACLARQTAAVAAAAAAVAAAPAPADETGCKAADWPEPCKYSVPAEVSGLVFQAFRDAEALVRTGGARSSISASLVHAALQDSGFVDPSCLKDACQRADCNCGGRCAICKAVRDVSSRDTAALPVLQAPKRSQSAGSLAQAARGEIGGVLWGAAVQRSSPPAVTKDRALPRGARTNLRDGGLADTLRGGSVSPHRNWPRAMATQQMALGPLRVRVEKAELRPREL